MELEKRRPKRKRKKTNYKSIVIGIVFAAIFVTGVVLAIYRYAPTNEHMLLTEYFNIRQENAAAVILNGEYIEESDADTSQPYAIRQDGTSYIRLSFLKQKLDDGYVYDEGAGILRYATDKDLATAYTNSSEYSIGRETRSLDEGVVLMSLYEGIYINMDFVSLFTDITYYGCTSPDRVVIETAGLEKTVATLRKDSPLRRFGGPKSLILKDALKGDKLIVLENYGKWSSVLTDDGVIGCVRNRHIGNTKEEKTPNNLPAREYEHLLLDKKVKLGWHQMMSASGNASVTSVLNSANGINVISPTWFRLSDNNGGIENISDSNYVTVCHEKGVSVWGMVGNVDNTKVNTTTVLNSTASRDALVNNLIAAAIAVGMDGINVDFESLQVEVTDGYIQFIRELSLRCESNGLILSVDNYKPTEFTAFYNRAEQAKYADYIIVMAYDEYYSTSDTAGSTASLGFVKEAAEDTLKEVPKNQLILGLPFYTRVWKTKGGVLTNAALGMSDIPAFIDRHNATMEWRDDVGQYYAEFTESDVFYQVWIEDSARSFDAKLSVAKSNDLAGVAFWKLGFEDASVWNLINEYYN